MFNYITIWGQCWIYETLSQNTTTKIEDSLHRNKYYSIFKSDPLDTLEQLTYLRWIAVWPLNLTYQFLFSVCEPEPLEKNILINLSHAYS